MPAGSQKPENRTFFPEDMDMYAGFSPEGTDLPEIFHFQGSLKFFFPGSYNLSKFHIPASAEIQKALALFACDGHPHKTWDHFFRPSSRIMLSIRPRIHISSFV